MVLLEGLHELGDDLTFGPLTLSHVWVHARVVLLGEFFEADGLVLVEVQGFESSFNERSSELVHFTDNYSEEFVETYLASTVNIH